MNKRVVFSLIPLLSLASCNSNDHSFNAFVEPELQKVSSSDFDKALSNDKYSQPEKGTYGYVFSNTISKVATFKKIISNKKTFAIDKYILGSSISFDGVYHETGNNTQIFDFVSSDQETDEFKLQKTSDGYYQYIDKKTGEIKLYDSSYFENTFKPSAIKTAADRCAAFRPAGGNTFSHGVLDSLETIFKTYMQDGANKDDYFDFYVNKQESFFKVSLRDKFHNDKVVTDNNKKTHHLRVIMEEFDYSFYCGIVLKEKVVYYQNYDVGTEGDRFYHIFDTVNTIYQ